MAAEPLRAYLGVQRRSDAELKRRLERAARDARAQIRRLPRGNVRRAQLERVLRSIQRGQRAMWANDVDGVVRAGRIQAVQAAQEAADALTRELWRRVPERQARALETSFRVASGEGVGTTRDQRELSSRVVGTGRLVQRRLDDTIQSALTRQLTADELAREVYQFISPTVPGGASYAAMRIARTEINNAFHRQQIAQGQRPGVEAIEWNLSGTHKVPDECNVYAKKRDYPPDAVPDKPHPQCLCYLTYKMADVDDFLAALESGAFDDVLGVESPPPVKKAPPRKAAKKTTPAKKAAPAAPAVLSGAAALDSVRTGLIRRGSLTPRQRKSWKEYESSFFVSINNYHRRGRRDIDGNRDPLVERITEDMDATFQPLASDVQTWRGIARANRLFGDALGNDLSGFQWDELGYGSTSIDEVISRQFSNQADSDDDQRVMMRVTVARGVGASAVSHPRNQGGQGEIALQRNTQWRVTRDHGVDPTGIRYIDVEVTLP